MSSLNVSGDIQITDNIDKNGVESNVLVGGWKTELASINVTGVLADTAKIGVSMWHQYYDDEKRNRYTRQERAYLLPA